MGSCLSSGQAGPDAGHAQPSQATCDDRKGELAGASCGPLDSVHSSGPLQRQQSLREEQKQHQQAGEAGGRAGSTLHATLPHSASTPLNGSSMAHSREERMRVLRSSTNPPARLAGQLSHATLSPLNSWEETPFKTVSDECGASGAAACMELDESCHELHSPELTTLLDTVRQVWGARGAFLTFLQEQGDVAESGQSGVPGTASSAPARTWVCGATGCKEWEVATCKWMVSACVHAAASGANALLASEDWPPPPLAVPDMARDPRFASTAQVAAGAASSLTAPLLLHASGPHPVWGALCITGSKPRSFSTSDATLLTNFASLAAREAERLDDVAKQLEGTHGSEQQSGKQAAFGGAAGHLSGAAAAAAAGSPQQGCVLVLDASTPEWPVLHASSAWADMTGLPQSSVSGASMDSLFNQAPAKGSGVGEEARREAALGHTYVTQEVRLRSRPGRSFFLIFNGAFSRAPPSPAPPAAPPTAAPPPALPAPASPPAPGASLNSSGADATPVTESGSSDVVVASVSAALATLGPAAPNLVFATLYRLPERQARTDSLRLRCQRSSGIPASPLLSLSSLFEGLRPVRVAGEGRFGIVWRCTWHEAPVAVKVQDYAVRSEADHQEAEKEVLLGQQLSHPHIVRFVAYAAHAMEGDAAGGGANSVQSSAVSWAMAIPSSSDSNVTATAASNVGNGPFMRRSLTPAFGTVHEDSSFVEDDAAVRSMLRQLSQQPPLQQQGFPVLQEDAVYGGLVSEVLVDAGVSTTLVDLVLEHGMAGGAPSILGSVAADINMDRARSSGEWERMLLATLLTSAVEGGTGAAGEEAAASPPPGLAAPSPAAQAVAAAMATVRDARKSSGVGSSPSSWVSVTPPPPSTGSLMATGRQQRRDEGMAGGWDMPALRTSDSEHSAEAASASGSGSAMFARRGPPPRVASAAAVAIVAVAAEGEQQQQRGAEEPAASAAAQQDSSADVIGEAAWGSVSLNLGVGVGFPGGGGGGSGRSSQRALMSQSSWARVSPGLLHIMPVDSGSMVQGDQHAGGDGRGSGAESLASDSAQGSLFQRSSLADKQRPARAATQGPATEGAAGSGSGSQSRAGGVDAGQLRWAGASGLGSGGDGGGGGSSRGSVRRGPPSGDDGGSSSRDSGRRGPASTSLSRSQSLEFVTLAAAAASMRRMSSGQPRWPPMLPPQQPPGPLPGAGSATGSDAAPDQEGHPPSLQLGSQAGDAVLARRLALLRQESGAASPLGSPQSERGGLDSAGTDGGPGTPSLGTAFPAPGPLKHPTDVSLSSDVPAVAGAHGGGSPMGPSRGPPVAWRSLPPQRAQWEDPSEDAGDGTAPRRSPLLSKQRSLHAITLHPKDSTFFGLLSNFSRLESTVLTLLPRQPLAAGGLAQGGGPVAGVVGLTRSGSAPRQGGLPRSGSAPRQGVTKIGSGREGGIWGAGPPQELEDISEGSGSAVGAEGSGLRVHVGTAAAGAEGSVAAAGRKAPPGRAVTALPFKDSRQVHQARLQALASMGNVHQERTNGGALTPTGSAPGSPRSQTSQFDAAAVGDDSGSPAPLTLVHQPLWHTLGIMDMAAGEGMAAPVRASTNCAITSAANLHGIVTAAGNVVCYPLQLRIYMVMEFMDKGCLQDAIDCHWLHVDHSATQPINVKAVLETAAELSSALAYLHERGVVHGDLSAANVLLKSMARPAPAAATAAAAAAAAATDGTLARHSQAPRSGASGGSRAWSAKLCDFGLSVTLPDGADCVTVKGIGTVTHAAPEVLASSTLSRAADVYSLGVLLWQLLSGATPWRRLSQEQIMVMVGMEKMALTFPEGCDEYVKALAQWCMLPDREQRPSAAEVHDSVAERLAEMDVYGGQAAASKGRGAA